MKAATTPASDALRDALPRIALNLERFGILGEVDESLRRERGAILAGVVDGEPAGKLFRQDERTKPPRKNQREIAIAFYYAWARSNSKETAIDHVQRNTYLDPPGPARIEKYARSHRDIALEYLEECAGTDKPVVYRSSLRALTGEDEDDSLLDDLEPLSVESVRRLREFLRKKRARAVTDK